jgi:tRNA threonylcarbamoyladenosine biosynthesis protein TsaB
MRLLAMDSSSRITGVGLWWGEEAKKEETPALGEIQETEPGHGGRASALGPALWADSGHMEREVLVEDDRARAEQMLTDLDGLLKVEGLTLDQVDGLVVSLGPGSFTGLRISVTMAKTLAQFTGLPLYGISTLEGWAASLGPDQLAAGRKAAAAGRKLLVPLIDARADRIYAAAFAVEEGGLQPALKPVLPESLYLEADLAARLQTQMATGVYGQVLFLGTDLPLHQRLLDQVDFPFQVIDAKTCPSPLPGLCRLAYRRALRGEGDSYLDLKPNYLRKSQAELTLEAKERKSSSEEAGSVGEGRQEGAAQVGGEKKADSEPAKGTELGPKAGPTEKGGRP